MSRVLKDRLYLSVFLFLLFPVFTAKGEAASGRALSAYDKGHPYYWRAMIASLPPENLPEAIFKDVKIGDTKASGLLNAAVASFNENSYKKTIEQLKDIAARFPDDEATTYAYYLIGDCYSKMAEGNDAELLKESVSAYLTAVRMYPLTEEAPRGLYQAGRGLFYQGFYYEAIAQMNRISTRYPESIYAQKAVVAKGIIYFYQKKYRMSESLLRNVVNSDTAANEEKGLSSLWLANTLHMKGMNEEARGLYKTVEREWPDYLKGSKISLLLMGDNFLILGDSRSCRDSFEECLKLYPDSDAVPVVMLRVADAYRMEGKQREAFKAYSTVVSQYPAVDVVIIGKARIAEFEIEKGNTGTAAPLMIEIISLNGDLAREAALIITEAYNKAGMQAEAARGYKAVLERFGEMEGTDLKGKLAESLRDTISDAYNKKDHLAVLKLYHEDSKLLKKFRVPKFLRMIGDSYMEVGLPLEASALYEEILYSRSKDSKALTGPFLEETLFRSAEAYIKAENREEAAKTIKRLMAEFPGTHFKEKLSRLSSEIKVEVKQDGTADGYFIAAGEYLKKKRFKEAADYYKKVINLKEPSLLASSYIGLGDSYFGMGKYKDAVNAYETGKAGGGEMGFWAGYKIGESYFNLGDMQKAQAAFQAVAREDKGVYGKMAAEELKRVEMNVKNSSRVDWNTWVSKPVGTVHLEKEKNDRRRVD